MLLDIVVVGHHYYAVDFYFRVPLEIERIQKIIGNF